MEVSFNLWINQGLFGAYYAYMVKVHTRQHFATRFC